MRVEPLDEQHDRAGFASGVEPLDRYLRVQAGQDAHRRVASCFVLIDETPTPIAYYTLAATSVALTDLPAATAKRLPRYPLVPATLIGRLAVDHRQWGKGFGEFMLLDAFARALRSDIATFAIVVDAKNESAEAFYRSYEFAALDTGSRRLFLPMTSVARLFV